MKKNIIFRIVQTSQLFMLLLFCIIPLRSWAACSWNGNTGTVASPYNQTNVADCVSDASWKTGDVVIQIPACNAQWNAPLTIDMSSGFTNVTSLTLQGSGSLPTTCASATSAGLTVPTSCGAATSRGTSITMSSAGIRITGAPGKKWRVSNLSISGSADTYYAMIQPIGTSMPSNGGGFRIDHITFRDCTSMPFKSTSVGTTAGVIDHIDSVSSGQFSNWAHLNAGGNTLWSSDVYQEDMIWIEDSYIENTAGSSRMVADAHDGASVGIRYSGIKEYYLSGHDFSSNNRGIRRYEFYNNQMKTTATADGGFGGSLLDLRGGTGVCYNNLLITSNANVFATCTDTRKGICLMNYRSLGLSLPQAGWNYVSDTHCEINTSAKMCVGTNWGTNDTKFCTRDSDCGGASGSCTLIDGTGTNNYPCRDQIGRGKNQNAEPMLFWNNTLKVGSAVPVTATVGVHNWGSNTSHIQKNRDFCDNATVMPSSCNGVTTTYTAYTYPHPLRGGNRLSGGAVAGGTF